MQDSSGEQEAITGINVTPLVDIILVVLIIFMATAPLIQRRTVNVDVPKAKHHERAAPEALQLVFAASRALHLAGKPIARDRLESEMRGRTKADPGLRILLSADRSIPYGEVIALLDLLRGAGARKVSLELKR